MGGFLDWLALIIGFGPIVVVFGFLLISYTIPTLMAIGGGLLVWLWVWAMVRLDGRSRGL